MEGACEKIKNNKYFKELSATIRFRKYIKRKNKQRSSGRFSLDLLEKLYGIKDSFGNSILTWICAKIKKDDASFKGMKCQFPKLEKVVSFSLNETSNNVNNLKIISS